MKKYLVIEHDCMGDEQICLTEQELRGFLKDHFGDSVKVVGQFVRLPRQPTGMQA